MGVATHLLAAALAAAAALLAPPEAQQQLKAQLGALREGAFAAGTRFNPHRVSNTQFAYKWQACSVFFNFVQAHRV